MLRKLVVTLHRKIRNDGVIAQLVEQRTENPCVPGSIPGDTTSLKYLSVLGSYSLNFVGVIAQLVEQRTENPCVPGSIPGGTTEEIANNLNDRLLAIFNSITFGQVPYKVTYDDTHFIGMNWRESD